jgi:hypothetical protein
VTNWTQEPRIGEYNVFSTPWPHVFLADSPTRSHPGGEENKLIGRVEQVFIQGYPLHQVLSRQEVGRGTFFVDEQTKRIYACRDDNQDLSGNHVRVEISTRPEIWLCQGDFIKLRGFDFRYAANRAQQGAAQFAGRGDVVENCTFEKTNGVGAAFLGDDETISTCTFTSNGQLGFGANRTNRLHLVDCVISNNNLKDFPLGWEAGGDKICMSRGTVLDHCTFERNFGPGIWFDIGNEQPTVCNCLIANNEGAGIFYEISQGLHACDNVVTGNGFSFSPGAWGARGGICLSSSPGAVIERNLIVGNREGFDFREQMRTTPVIGLPNGSPERATWNHDEVIRNNVLAYNQDAQTWGWFDVKDNRHLPRSLQSKTADAATRPKADMAADYSAKTNGGQPTGLSLETLNIRFESNIYSTLPGQRLFIWGTDWSNSKLIFDSLEPLLAKLNFEQGSQLVPIYFHDAGSRDLRVEADSPAVKMDCYPHGTVPGVQLGIVAKE